ncbi:sugar ABC transporter substrate-binding protein [Nakamurella silvestris]|nr:sugar ABC transporter substrate-binding protein [Nakamurella silvestris]
MKISRRLTTFAAATAAVALVATGCSKSDDNATPAPTSTSTSVESSVSAPETSAPDTSAPDTSAPDTSAPDTSASGEAPTGTVEKASKDFKIAYVPKLQGVPYFEAMNKGGAKAATDLGITWLYQGPTAADASAQADVVRSFIQQKVDALFVAPNDPDSMAPVLQEAATAGIKVGTADTDAPDSVREVFVNQASEQAIGEGLTDALAKAMGEKGSYAIVSCGETAANLNAWIAVQKEYAASKYPDMKLIDVVYAGEDQAKATAMATDLMNANPDLTGLVGECTSSAPGVAEAVRNADKIGTVFTVGLGTPQSMKPYLLDGSSSASILWNVENLGYLTAWAGVQLAEGKEFAATNYVNADLPAVEYDATNKQLLLGPALQITKENVDQFDY